MVKFHVCVCFFFGGEDIVQYSAADGKKTIGITSRQGVTVGTIVIFSDDVCTVRVRYFAVC